MRPSTFTRSTSRSAFEPSSVTVAPFTETRPATINSSDLRRLATPARARIFCKRSSAIALFFHRRRRRLWGFGGRGCFLRREFLCVFESQPAQLFEFLKRWQLRQ